MHASIAFQIYQGNMLILRAAQAAPIAV
jgi:hypothetical protein